MTKIELALRTGDVVLVWIQSFLPPTGLAFRSLLSICSLLTLCPQITPHFLDQHTRHLQQFQNLNLYQRRLLATYSIQTTVSSLTQDWARNDGLNLLWFPSLLLLI